MALCDGIGYVESLVQAVSSTWRKISRTGPASPDGSSGEFASTSV